MRKVIIINDSRLEKAVLKDQLTNLGYKIIVANEYDWFSKVRKEQPDIAIVNYTMQEITGDKIISTINANFTKVQCYLSSCNKLKAEDFKEIEIKRVITTPVSLTSLEKILNDIVFCSFCGKPLTDNFRFCPYCGEEVGM